MLEVEVVVRFSKPAFESSGSDGPTILSAAAKIEAKTEAKTGPEDRRQKTGDMRVPAAKAEHEKHRWGRRSKPHFEGFSEVVKIELPLELDVSVVSNLLRSQESHEVAGSYSHSREMLWHFNLAMVACIVLS